MENEIVKKVSDEIMEIIFDKFSNIRFFKKKGNDYYTIKIRTVENVDPAKIFDRMYQLICNTKEKTNFIGYDKDHMMNSANGCIFNKTTFEIKGYE